MYSGPVHIQVNDGRRGDPRLPFLINRGRVLLGPMLQHAEARGPLGVQKDRYVMDDGSYVDAIVTPYVTIISVTPVYGVGGEAQRKKRPKYEDPHTFTASPAHYFTDAESWVQAWASYSPETDTYGWRGGYQGARGEVPNAELPCGNMTWFPAAAPVEGEPLTEDDIKAREVPSVVSWNGPSTGYWADPIVEAAVEAEPLVWVDFPLVETVRLDAPGPVVGACIAPDPEDAAVQRLSLLVMDSGTSPVQLQRYDYVPDTEEPTAPWVSVWTTSLDGELDYLRSHVTVSPDATEARGLASYKATYTDPDPNVDPTRHADLKTMREFVLEYSTGTVTYDWDDYDTYPRFRESRQVTSTTSAGPDNYKRYYIKDEVTAGTTTSFTVSHEPGVDTSGHERLEMPYPGEEYLMDPLQPWFVDEGGQTYYPRSVFRVVSCTAHPDVSTETTGYLQRRVDMLQPDGTYRGRWAVLEVEWLVVGEDPNNSGAAMVYQADTRPGILNNDGQCHLDFQYEEDTDVTAHMDEFSPAKVIVGVGYDLDGSVVKAFLEPEHHAYQFFRYAFGHLSGKTTELDNNDPEVWGTSTPPPEWTEEPPDDPNGADYASIFLDGWNWSRTYMLVEGGRHDGKRMRLTCFGRRVDNYFRYTGYYPIETLDYQNNGQTYLDKGGNKYDYAQPFATAQYKNSILQYYHPESLAGPLSAERYVNLQRGMADGGEEQVDQFAVEWLELKDFLLTGTPNGEPQCDVYYTDRNTGTMSDVGVYGDWSDILASPQDIDGFQADTSDGLMPPAAAVIGQNTDARYTVQYSNEWLRAYYHAPDTTEAIPGADEEVMGIYGVAGQLGNVSVGQQGLVAFSCHTSNTTTRERTFYSWNGNSTVVGVAANYPYSGAVSYYRVAAASLFSPWRGATPSTINSSFKFLYGDNTQDLTYVNPEAGKTWEDLFFLGQELTEGQLTALQVVFGRRSIYRMEDEDE